MVTLAGVGNVFPNPGLSNIAMMIAVHESHYQPPSVPRSRDRDALATPRPPSHSPRPSVSSSAAIAGAQARSERTCSLSSSTTATTTAAAATTTTAAAATSTTSQERAKPASPTRRSVPDTAARARLPSPPPSSASEPSSSDTQPQPDPHRHVVPHPPPYASSSSCSFSSCSTTTTTKSAISSSRTSTNATVVAAPPSRSIPSPGPEGGPRWTASLAGPAPPLSLPPIDEPPVQTQTTIRVRDLEHIQDLARSELLNGTGPSALHDPPLQHLKFDISSMPICDIIEMVAALLTKITSTNDLQHDALNRNAHHVRQAQAQGRAADGSADGSLSPLSSSVLAFHGKNVPAITILSYLTRIHKYCPTTFEVFLSLLVYFDRMTERVNDMVMKSEEARRRQLQEQQRQLQQEREARRHRRQQSRSSQAAAASARVNAQPRNAAGAGEEDVVMRDRDDHGDNDDDDDDDNDDNHAMEDDDNEDDDRRREGEAMDEDASSNATETDSDLADSTDGDEATDGTGATSAGLPPHPSSHATFFVVDSFNIHRLIIAGVTCASKFFSDVFYTNSRYAKVGGLPLPELNHLELQFLLLNDFRLAVPVEDLEAYATMLVEFYAREVVGSPSSSPTRP
ncbi:hypothetical protein VTJ83DRAFT_3079 [Remersonia thermophila]|uniref:Cyclin-domain-containing protein n=1 Tax=Remersonia thermophila TaxID=72144 RepID=A0ABR4DD11_9PEZI